MKKIIFFDVEVLFLRKVKQIKNKNLFEIKAIIFLMYKKKIVNKN